ncbi:MAG: dienelactone hydrolase family protein [Candidatus Nanopelagicales bacterium]
MAHVALIHSVLGIRPGVTDAADRLRAAGHEVLVPDLFEGRVFDTYEPALQYAEEELGHVVLHQRAQEAVTVLPDGFVSIGFSLGSMIATRLAAVRPVSGVVQLAGAVPMSWFDASWPAGVPAQTHQTLGDPWREAEALEQALTDVAAGGATLEVFDYPGSGHLFTDPSLPDEYDAEATELLWSRVLPFVGALD